MELTLTEESRGITKNQTSKRTTCSLLVFHSRKSPVKRGGGWETGVCGG